MGSSLDSVLISNTGEHLLVKGSTFDDTGAAIVLVAGPECVQERWVAVIDSRASAR